MFDEIWNEHAGAVYAFAARRVGRSSADDVVADVFAVAWSRISEMPGRRLPWLYGVAKNVIREHHRRENRQRRLESHVADSPATGMPLFFEDGVTDRLHIVRALATLDEPDQEALLLVAWDEMTPGEAATVVGISAPAFRMRLVRARRRLRTAMNTTPSSQMNSMEVTSET
ncbi:MAG: sigma-70 family RNA polymerase sigma factor [Acidimicrobiia bacterium]